MFTAYNEATTGQRLLDLLHSNVGDWVEVTVRRCPDLTVVTVAAMLVSPPLRPRAGAPGTAPVPAHHALPQHLKPKPSI
jgi:hypothetical protein